MQIVCFAHVSFVILKYLEYVYVTVCNYMVFHRSHVKNVFFRWHCFEAFFICDSCSDYIINEVQRRRMHNIQSAEGWIPSSWTVETAAANVLICITIFYWLKCNILFDLFFYLPFFCSCHVPSQLYFMQNVTAPLKKFRLCFKMLLCLLLGKSLHVENVYL